MTAANATSPAISTIDTFTEFCGKLTAWATLAVMLCTCFVVVARYFFGSGSIALQETVIYLHAFAFMLGTAFTLKRGGHVRVDIFYRNFSPRQRALVDTCGAVFFLLPTCALIFWLSFDYVRNSWAIYERSAESAGLPWVYLLKTLLLIMPSLLLLQGIGEFLKSLRTLRDPANSPLTATK
ncbi:MAG: TRAP transporter small permease subunit [Gammaproteobacteria bacterium]|nr:TRAP transporter small permease subunit [Gammaproteobacteria bacterium]MBQ0839284.1 TRAP transporter small permease subunit [Gammaproteobacteria bacterium]